MLVEFFKSRNGTFRTRSGERDRQSDVANIARVAEAIDQALRSSRSERVGLDRRLADVTTRAAISAGNGTDEYLTRDEVATERLNAFDAEIRSAQRRLAQLDHNISQFEALKEEFLARFPDGSGVVKE
jgi:predicted  nucleic acid-binding Zn-ribbon protein